MKNILILLFVISVIGLGFFFFKAESPLGEQPSVGTSEPVTTTLPNVSEPPVIAPSGVDDLQPMETTEETLAELSDAAVSELDVALDKAVQQRESAEQALSVIELEIEALEAQLDSIDLSADDQVDATGETLDSFQKIFADYQDAIQVFEEAKEKEEWIQAKIDEAG